MAVFGFDIDGVISNCYLGFNFLRRFNLDYLLYEIIKKLKLFPFCYWTLRGVNEKTKRYIQSVVEEGHKIVVITAVEEIFREEVEKWLKKHDIPFHKLYLRPVGENIVEFKVKMIKKSRCEIYFDDRKEIINAIKNCGCSPILYSSSFDLEFYLRRI